MRIGMSSTPPSRQGKKQVIAFLKPVQIIAAYQKAQRENKTNQEIIGEAVNAVVQSHGMPALVKTGHHRIVRRKQGKARMRDDFTGPTCRAGTHAYAAWFEEDVVARLKLFSSEIDLPVQSILEQGISLITGVSADKALTKSNEDIVSQNTSLSSIALDREII